MFVIFVGKTEVIVTTKVKEAETIKAYFTPGAGGRYLDDYDRQESGEDAVAIEFRSVVR